jgi:hypothetical protein
MKTTAAMVAKTRYTLIEPSFNFTGHLVIPALLYVNIGELVLLLAPSANLARDLTLSEIISADIFAKAS